MEEQLPPCPECGSEYSYSDGEFLNCPECGHQWTPGSEARGAAVALDANGNELSDGDTVVVARNLKVKGAQGDLKMGTKVKNIRIVEGDHNIDCKIPGFGAMKLKSEFVKKQN
jgi:protein PhnA